MVTIADLDNDLLTERIKPVVGMTELTNSSTYHFALTAFDTQGKTSDFSEELCVEVVGSSVVECRSADTGSETGGGGDVDNSAENGAGSGSGGGGGCFIAASSFGFRETVVFLLPTF
jgi:hypothetical protein